jgi:hypothetical protein
VLIRRRSILLVLLVLLAAPAGGVLPARAAEPVAYDAVVTVTFTEAAAGYDLAGAALAGADVSLVARLGGADPALQVLAATTDAAGAARFSGVARGVDGTPVLLSVVASRTSTTPIGACHATDTRSGSIDGVVSEQTLPLDLIGFLSSTTSCPAGGAIPPGVEPDGAVIVSVTSEGSGIPLAATGVTLTATTADGPFQSLAGTTDDEGRATFSGVGRPTGGVPVTLTAAVSFATSVPADGCTTTYQWSGSARAPGAAGTVEIAVSAGLAATVSCAPPGPDAPVLTGSVVDASGAPVPIAAAWLAMSRSDGARWVGRIEPTAGGQFAARLHPWGSDDDPAEVELRVVGVASGSRTAGDCTYTTGEVGSLAIEVALGEGFDPDPVTIVTTTGDLSSVCGASATPSPGTGSGTVSVPAPSDRPALTLPPTDAAAVLAQRAGTPLLPALVAVLGALALVLGWAVVRRDA